MRQYISFTKSTLLSGLAILFICLSPMTAFAAETPECVAPTDSGPGVHRPVGADSITYVYDCDDNTWKNDHYIFYPSTSEVVPRDPVVYTYNPDTGKWDTTIWVYNAPKAKYVTETDSVTTPPKGAATVGGPVAPAPSTSSSNPSSNPSIAANSASSGGSSSVDTDGQLDVNSNNLTINQIANLLKSSSLSGDSRVTGNTTGGSATSGDAEAITTLINLLQTVGNHFDSVSDLVTFISNIDGDVIGDILLDPGQLAHISRSLNLDANVTVNNTTDNAINNDVTIEAQSGDARVNSNTSAGSANTGNAKAVANIINIVNSAITSGKSFLGVININGNLNGDILLPADFIDQLIAANVPTTTINTSAIVNVNATQTNINNTGINNNLSASATTGGANVNNNTEAGAAKTGNASTNITAFNLTGSNVIGKNSILVFVNVLGNWVGLIVNAPQGSTAAQLGGGITSNTNINANLNETNTTNNLINNNINVAAGSGDASVSDNTKAGNATSGDADAAINLLNIAGSNMSFGDWFGILFINVFGSWNGSFGVDTAAGNIITPPPSSPSVSLPAEVFKFIPASDPGVASSVNKFGKAVSQGSLYNVDQANQENKAIPVLGAATTTPPKAAQAIQTNAVSRWAIPLVFSGVMGAMLLSGEQITRLRKQRIAANA